MGRKRALNNSESVARLSGFLGSIPARAGTASPAGLEQFVSKNFHTAESDKTL